MVLSILHTLFPSGRVSAEHLAGLEITPADGLKTAPDGSASLPDTAEWLKAGNDAAREFFTSESR